MNDYAPVLRTLRAMLQPAIPKLTIVDASTAEEAEALARAERPDLVIVSDRVLVLYTRTFVHLLKEGPRTMVVVLTAHGPKAGEVQARAAGADAYLCKPFGMVEVRELVEWLLRRTISEEEVRGEDLHSQA